MDLILLVGLQILSENYHKMVDFSVFVAHFTDIE